jgi:hypothetical protein
MSNSLGYTDSRNSWRHLRINSILANIDMLPKHGRVVEFVLNYVLNPNQAGDLINLLTHSRNCGAGDKRDRVYAFLGLTKEISSINVDYSDQNNAVEVFTETAQRLIERHGDLSILSHVDMRDNEQLEFPSWVPDWSSTRRWTWRLALGDVAGVTRSLREENTVFLDGGKTLEVSGVYMDTIQGWAEVPSFKRSENLPLKLSKSVKEYSIWSTTNACIGDQLWILYGMETPVLLRATGTAFKFISEAPVFKPPEYENYGRKAKVYDRWEREYTARLLEPPVRVRLV